MGQKYEFHVINIGPPKKGMGIEFNKNTEAHEQINAMGALGLSLKAVTLHPPQRSFSLFFERLKP